MKRVSRRSFLRTASATVGAGLVVPGSAGLVRAQAEPPWTPIGFSQGGSPLIVHHFGESPLRVFVLGGQHGAPEANTIRLVRSLIHYFADNPRALPATVGIDFMPVGNPDGAAAGIRQYLSGVDPNRNWGGQDWQADAYDSNGQFRRGLGGSEPFSEQETVALADWFIANRPAYVVNLHSAGGFMFGGRDGIDGELADAYAGASGYRRPTPSGGSPLSYRASGTMNSWMRTIGLGGIFIELTTPSDPELARNLAGLRALVERLGELSAGSSV